MKVVRDQGPRVALGFGFFQYVSQPIQEGFTVFVVLEKLPPFNSPSHGRVEGGLESLILVGAAWFLEKRLTRFCGSFITLSSAHPGIENFLMNQSAVSLTSCGKIFFLKAES
jgi:hypothetical protein